MAYLGGLLAGTTINRSPYGGAYGFRHDPMPGDRYTDSDRHRGRSSEVPTHASVYRARLLCDLPHRARVVCQGGVGGGTAAAQFRGRVAAAAAAARVCR